MGLFRRKKKVVKEEPKLDKLVDGDLPFGWFAANHNTIDPIAEKFRVFLKLWVDSRTLSPNDLRVNLKTFVAYMDEVDAFCKSKDECFVFWRKRLFSDDYLEKRKKELSELEANIDTLQAEYMASFKRMMRLRKELIPFLKEHDGILQTELYTHFPDYKRSEISDLLYEYQKNGLIKKTKSGRTNKINITS